MIRARDRRAHRRVATDLELQVAPPDGSVVARLVASNLSLGGLYCVSTADFTEMTRLAVRFVLPDGAPVPRAFDAEAVVVRREELAAAGGNGARYRLALFFTRMDEQDRQHLARWLERQPD